jgi:phage shock protein A
MSNLSEIVDSLENRIGKLLNEHESLKQANSTLEGELAAMKQKCSELEHNLQHWKAQHESLKLSNAMLGSDQYKRETKLKINSLIREIDQCITQLTE